MRHRLTRILTLLLSLTCAAPVAAQVELLRAGAVCPDGRNGPLRDAPGTLLGGVREIAGFSVDVETREIPLLPGLGLGIETRWTGDAPRTVQIVTLHPPMGDARITRQHYTRTLTPGAINVRAYTFEFAYEMLPGPWTFQVEDETGILLSVDFTVSDAPNAAVTEACGLFLNS